MKYKRVIWICFILLPFIAFPQQKNEVNPNGYNTFYYDNGNVSSEGTMKDGKPDGYWKNYYENGKIKNEGNRKNFQLDSTWKFYDEKGRLTKSFDYKEGQKNGFVTTYDTSGNITLREQYQNNIKSGASTSYYKSGKTKFVVPFKNGRADGVAYEYSEDSVIKSITHYKMGFIDRFEKINAVDASGNKQGMWKEFYDDGTVKSETRYRDNQIDGYKKEFDKKGDLKSIEKFNDGKKVMNAPELAQLDVFKAYFDNGQVRYEGGYIKGLPIGTHYYYKLGKEICDSVNVVDDTIMRKVFRCERYSVPDSAIVYDEGYLIERGAVDSIRRKQGPWIEYYTTGEIKGKGNYKDNNKNGPWKYTYPEGKLEQEGKYNKYGQPTGEWKWYYESGALLREEHYRGGKREGLMQEFKEDGKLITKGEYLDDEKEGMWYYEIDNYKEIGKYVAGLPDSIWTAYYVKENQLLFKGNFLAGEPDGKHIMYYPDGKVMSVGNYLGGLKEGNWKYYDEFGQLIITIDYENGIERKWNNQVILPTYEESLRAYEGVKKNSSVTKDTKTTENVNEPEK